MVRRERRTSDGRSPREERVTADRVTSAPTAAPALASVIVVCWNSEDVLGRCLEHLFAQDYVNREIIVVDDGSDDGTVRVAEEARERCELKLLRSARNRGCPHARNLGLRHAQGEIVAFVDADGFATPRWLSEIVAAFGDDPGVGGVASTVFFDDNPLVVNGAGGIVNRQGWAADLAMNESYEGVRIAGEALYPMGCGMALRRAALERVGPFDDRMLNYYDDVDYGTRLWRAGYRVEVAPDAWIDHGSGTGGDPARKRLLCERHRMRVVLKHAPVRTLGTWATQEARSMRAATTAIRAQKLRSIAWNLRHLASVLASRRRLRNAPSAPESLIDPSWGDGFPVGVALRLRPAPRRARANIEMDDPGVEGQLLYGWFPSERIGGRSYRWAAPYAAALVRLDKPAGRLHLDYAHVPVDTGPIDVRVRRVGSEQPLRPVWTTCLSWQYIARSVENHPIALPPGDYEVVFRAARGWSDPPQETRSLALALSKLTFAGSFDIPAGGLQMTWPSAESQLVRGWFEAEESPERRYRWGAGRAAAVVRLSERARSARLSYCLPPRSIGSLRISLSPLGQRDESFSRALAWHDSNWHDESLALDLDAGDYLVSFETEATWSNQQGHDWELWAENRALGFALSALTFSAER